LGINAARPDGAPGTKPAGRVVAVSLATPNETQVISDKAIPR
jgi:hypothetical protein